MEIILALILSISAEYGVPSGFVQAIVQVESEFNCNAINRSNKNGTVDYGLMQLNSSWFTDENWREPEVNLRAGIRHIKWLMETHSGTSWWALAISYNAGSSWLINNHDPPKDSVLYADKVMEEWEKIEKNRPIMVRR